MAEWFQQKAEMEARGLVPVEKEVLKKEDVAVKREDMKAEDME